MEKIKDLLSKIGASKQLQESLISELDSFVKATEAKYEKLFKERKEKAIKVCTEEVEGYKRELANKVSVFLESKQAQMARANEKQLALESTEAADKLNRIKAVVEGVKLNDAGTVTNENKQLHERVLALEQANARLVAERDVTAKRAARAQTIANDVLKANRVLEAKLVKSGKVVSEEVPPVIDADDDASVDAKVPGVDVTDETKADEAKMDEAKMDEVTDEVKTDEVKTDEVKTDEVKTDEVKATDDGVAEVLEGKSASKKAITENINSLRRKPLVESKKTKIVDPISAIADQID